MASRFPRRLGAAIAVALFAFFPLTAHASGSEAVANGFLWIAILLIAAKLGTLVERVRLPVVLGEILAGVILGNLALVGFDFLDPIRTDAIIGFLAQLGAVILLFQLGLESSIRSMQRVGLRATAVAAVGVVVPFVIGAYFVGPLLLPGLSHGAYLFLGAALTATSVGITGRVFRDMNALQRSESQIVLGAAVIDDVLGLVILAVVSSIALQGTVSATDIATITSLAVGFLVAALVLGQVLARHLGRLFARLDSSHASKLSVAVAFCLVFAYLADLIGLAPIVGAFAAGLILDEAHFKWFDDPSIKRDVIAAMKGGEPVVRQRVRAVLDRYADKHLEHMIEPLAHFTVPLFFVLAGMQVRLEVLFNPSIIAVALALSIAAIFGKLACWLVAGSGMNRWLVAWGMVPRGEVGLIFAFVGKSMGVLSDAAFSVIVVMVMVTTLVTPPVLSYLLRSEARMTKKAATNRIADQRT